MGISSITCHKFCTMISVKNLASERSIDASQAYFAQSFFTFFAIDLLCPLHQLEYRYYMKWYLGYCEGVNSCKTGH